MARSPINAVLVAVCLVLLPVLAASSAFAQTGSPGGTFRIVEVHLSADGSFAYIKGDPATDRNPDRCGGSDLYLLERATVGDRAFEQVVSLLTAAALADRRVAVWLSGCTAHPFWLATRPVLSSIRLLRD